MYLEKGKGAGKSMSHWVSTWGQAHTDTSHMSPQFKDNTMRLAIVNCMKGSQVRLRIANQTGKKPYTILQAAVQREMEEQVPVTFSGNASLEVQVGEEIYSDPVPLTVKPGELIVISMAFSGKVLSGNCISESVQGSRKGNYVEARQFTVLRKNLSACYAGMDNAIPALTSVEVWTEREDAGAFVCFGDSITQHSRWTKPLLEKVLEEIPGKLSVINKGIGGNRLLSGPGVGFLSMYGKAGMERFQRDVLEEAGVIAVLIAIGTNDFGMATDSQKEDWVTAQKLAQALETLVQQCREKGIRVYGSTILPRGGSHHYGKEAERERLRFNDWVRSTDVFDGVMDFDAVLRDKQNGECMAFAYDSGDHLHPHVLGGKKMAALAANILLRDFA